jgi:Cof subfamily protein (haloacid dehalogenase superfamily)
MMFIKHPYPCCVIPLICIDVDGTLVSASGVVTDTVWAAVDRALERGQHLALSTARGAFAAGWEMAERLDPDGWHVFHAGGATVHTGTGNVRGHSLDAAQLSTALAVAAENDWTLELYSAKDYAVASDDPFAVEHAGLIGVPFEQRSLDEFIAANELIVRVQFVVPESDIAAVTCAMEPSGLSVTSATSPIMPGAAFVSATQQRITKATGIAQICDDLGISMRHVMMIGDGLNDLAAIEAVGHPVAMGNAAPEVHRLARYTVADVDHDGVAEALDLSATLDPGS